MAYVLYVCHVRLCCANTLITCTSNCRVQCANRTQNPETTVRFVRPYHPAACMGSCRCYRNVKHITAALYGLSDCPSKSDSLRLHSVAPLFMQCFIWPDHQSVTLFPRFKNGYIYLVVHHGMVYQHIYICTQHPESYVHTVCTCVYTSYKHS